MPHWDEGPIRLKFHINDIHELICKVHVYESKTVQIGTIFLEQQSKRIIKYNFKHPDMRDIIDFLKEQRRDIEDKFGFTL